VICLDRGRPNNSNKTLLFCISFISYNSHHIVFFFFSFNRVCDVIVCLYILSFIRRRPQAPRRIATSPLSRWCASRRASLVYPSSHTTHTSHYFFFTFTGLTRNVYILLISCILRRSQTPLRIANSPPSRASHTYFFAYILRIIEPRPHCLFFLFPIVYVFILPRLFSDDSGTSADR